MAAAAKSGEHGHGFGMIGRFPQDFPVNDYDRIRTQYPFLRVSLSDILRFCCGPVKRVLSGFHTALVGFAQSTGNSSKGKTELTQEFATSGRSRSEDKVSVLVLLYHGR
jgi:hypothetical protein